MDEEVKQPSHVKAVLLTLIGVVIVVMILVVYISYSTGTPLSDSFKEVLLNNGAEVPLTNPGSNLPNPGASSPAGSASGGGSGGSSSDSGTSQTSFCTYQKVSYSLKNPFTNSTCNAYSNETCIDKTVSCSIEVYNRDLEISGVFTIEGYFVADGTSRFDSQISEINLAPEQSKKVYALSEIHSTPSLGDPGLADKDINCFFNTIEVPEKEVCS